MVTSETTSLPLAEGTALAEVDRIVAEAERQVGTVRVLGGVAIALRCGSARAPGPFARSYSDLDLVTDRKSGPGLTRALVGLQFEPERRFNALHGRRRMHFDRVADGIHVDVFVDEFVMCHRLRLSSRLGIHAKTLSLADLLLTKVQVAELNAKDVTDVAALLLDHELTPDEAGINVGYVTSLLAGDWGWWRTVSRNLSVLPGHLPGSLPAESRDLVTRRIEELVRAIESTPKSMRWKARSKAGDRIPWRDDPEETN